MGKQAFIALVLLSVSYPSFAQKLPDTGNSGGVKVEGEVNCPGFYRFPISVYGLSIERPTVIDVINAAGKVTPHLADTRHIQIRRFSRTGQQQIIAVDLFKLSKTGNPILSQGDTVYVPKDESKYPQALSYSSPAPRSCENTSSF